jgi:hypothetical protein
MEPGTFIDQYCERLGPGLLAEPLNLFSNLSFLVAALFALRLQRQNPTRASAVLVALMFAVFIGSSLFHSFATFWAELADVIPISLFSLYYIGYALRGKLRRSWALVIAGYAAFFVLTALGARLPSEWFNKSNGYFGTLAGLFILGVIARRTDRAYSNALLWGGVFFAVSLVFRSIDELICPSFPFGTHFLWHLINGLLLYTVAAAALTRAP